MKRLNLTLLAMALIFLMGTIISDLNGGGKLRRVAVKDCDT